MKNVVSEQDREDYEQEKQIRAWLEANGIAEDGFDFKSINSKGNVGHLGDVGAFSLDEKIKNSEGQGTYADLIKGSDGRDLFGGDDSGEEIEIDGVLLGLERLFTPLKLEREVQEWAIRIYQFRLNSSRLSI